MLDTSSASLSTSDVEECGRRKSVFYIPLSESLENYLPPTPRPSPPPPPVYTPAPQRLLLRARKSVTRSSLSPARDKSKAFNTFPTKAAPKNLGLSKCSSDIDFNEPEKKPSVNSSASELRCSSAGNSTLSLSVSMVNSGDNITKDATRLHSKSSETSKSQSDLSSIMLVKVQAKEIEVCKTPLKSTLSCGTADQKVTHKKERSFIGLSTSKSASRINLSSEGKSLLSTPKILKSNSKSNMSLLAADSPKSPAPGKEKAKTLPQNMITRSPAKSSSGSSIFVSPSKTDVFATQEKSAAKTPAFSLVRRSHSTKLTRSNSLLKAFTKAEPDVIDVPLSDIDGEYFRGLLKEFEDSCGKKDLVQALVYGTLVQGAAEAGLSPLQSRKSAIRGCLDAEDEAIHSDTSYEKACRSAEPGAAGAGGPGGAAGAPGTPAGSPSRLAAFFFSKRSLRASPLKRARSAAKLAPRAPLRSSRSHESLLSSPLSCGGSVRGGSVRALHASLAGRAHCFLLQLPGPPATTRHFACGSRIERDTWINSLRASLQAEGGNNIRRTERSLRLYLLEAKGLPPKKKYYCELMIDSTLYARTSSKLKTELCFWGEVFEFTGLPHVSVITVDVYREPDRKPRKRDKRFLVGSVKIPIHELSGRHQSERWHPLEGSDSPGGASLRAKCRYQSLEVLPCRYYSPLLMYLRDNYSQLVEYLEPVIGVKSKEEVAGALVGTVRCAGGAAAAARLLAAAAALEVRRAPHAALAFRANSLATKATEAYMKMLGETYLQETLWECVSGAMSGGCAWEVDPARGAGAGSNLRRQRARLRAAVSRAWRAVLGSAPRFPPDLRLCFAAFRDKLRAMQREELADHLVSASVFLRFLCPAILSPSLFGITHEYPDERAGRNLTLVAKALQTLANFTRFQGKEAYMEFLNDFLEEEAPNMRAFLNDISTLPPGMESGLQEEWGSGCPAGFLDLGKQLASLHVLLADSIPRLPPAAQQELDPLPSILETLTEELREQTGSQGDLTLHSPASIHDNIFRFNDPTYSPSNDNTLVHSSPLLGRNTVQINTISSSGSSQPDSTPSSLLAHMGLGKSPSLGIRAATLPRNNYNNVGPSNPERYSSQYNNKEHCVNLKVVQIGFDNKNASSPSLANKINGSSGNIVLHSSQRSVASDRSNADAYQTARNAFVDNGAVNSEGRMVHNNYSGSRDVFNRGNTESNGNMPKNLEELSDLLRYADDQEHEHSEENNMINQRITNHDIVPQTNVNIIANGNHGNVLNNGSNVSISALSNVASSGYQSFATYSQSSSPVELYAGQPANPNCCDGSPAHLTRRPGQIVMDNRIRNNYGKSNPQRFEYERQKFGIQNFTRDTGASSPKPLANGPLTFTNPVYHIENRVEESPFVQREDNGNILRQPPKRSVSTTSSSSIEEEEDDTTDNMETNSEGNFRNYRERNPKHPRRTARSNDKQKVNNAYQDAIRHTKSSAEPQAHRRLVGKSRSNGSELSAANNIDIKEHKMDVEPVPPLRRVTNSRLPRTNPLSSYSQPSNIPTNKNNIIHFGQNATESSYPNYSRNDARYSETSNRPDSNVEETNKEMYRLQISRSQKALYDRNNLDNFSNSNLPKMLEKYDVKSSTDGNGSVRSDQHVDGAVKSNFVKNNIEFGVLRVTENGYPLEKNYSSKTNLSNNRLNEEPRPSENGYPLDRSYSGLRQGPEDAGELAVRRLSLEGGGESSSEQEDGSYHTAGRRRVPKNHRTIHQYEREIERLKCSVDMLRQKLESVDLAEEPSTRGTDLADSKMKGIISRLLGVEEELRREQRAMAAALNRKQRVIERQGQRLAALGAANARLLSALHHLQPELAAQPLVTTDHSIIGHSEQLLNNLQADLRPLYETPIQQRPLFQEPKIPPYREPPKANCNNGYQQLENKEASQKPDEDSSYQYNQDKIRADLNEVQSDMRAIYQDSKMKQSIKQDRYGRDNSDSLRKNDTHEDIQPRYGIEKSPSRQFYQEKSQIKHHPIYNTDKVLNQQNFTENTSAQHQLFSKTEKSPTHQFYHDKNDNVHMNNLRNIERSASNQQLYYNRDNSPLHHSDSRQPMAYQERNLANLQNDSEYNRYSQNDVNRNSDPLSSRSYRGPNIEMTQQFIQTERPLIPAENHQAVVSTQPTVYYGNP